MHLNGGMMTAEEYDGLDGRNAALDLILNNAGAVTPYGVVYDNGMKLERSMPGVHSRSTCMEIPCSPSASRSSP